MATTPDLCLDPDPHLEDKIATIRNRARVWNDDPYRRMMQQSSQVVANRKRKLDHFTKRHGIDLFEFIKAKRSRLNKSKTMVRTIIIPV